MYSIIIYINIEIISIYFLSDNLINFNQSTIRNYIYFIVLLRPPHSRYQPNASLSTHL